MPLSNFFLWRSKPLRYSSIGVATLLIAIALGEWAGWPFLRTPLEKQLSKLTGAPADMEGKFRLQLLFNPGISVDSVTLGGAVQTKVPYLLQAKGLVVRWRWSDLWHTRQGDTLRLKRLEADEIDAHLVRLENGQASWLPNGPTPKKTASPSELPEIENLVLRSGDVEYRDEPLNINLKAHITQSTEPDTPLPWRATATGSYRNADLSLEAQAGPDLPLLAQMDDNPTLIPLRLKGRVGTTRLEFDGATGALWAGENLNGELTVRGTSLRTSGKPLGITLPDTPPYHLRGRIARQGAVWSIVTNNTTVGSSLLTAAMQFDTATTPPTLAGKLGGRRLAFADLAPAIGADKPPREANRVLPDEPFDVPSLARMNADVQVNLDQLDFGTPNIAPITDLKVHLKLNNSHLDLSNLSARVAGGLLTGSTGLQADKSPPFWDAALRFSEVDLERWIKGLKKDSAAASKDSPAYLSGKLSAKVELKGQGNSVSDILGNSNGHLDLELANGVMSQLVTEAIGLDAAQALGIVISGDVSLPLNCARAKAVIQDGVVKTRYAVIDNKDSTLHIQGGLSLKTEALQLRVVADPKDFSPLSLRSPLNVTGNFKKPQVSVEAKNLIARVAGAVVLGALSPPAALLAFIDTGESSESQPCLAPSAPKEKEKEKEKVNSRINAP